MFTDEFQGLLNSFGISGSIVKRPAAIGVDFFGEHKVQAASYFTRMFRIMIFLNDRAFLNERYRKHLMESFKKDGFSVSSYGFFDGIISFVKSICYVLFTSHLIVSSNLKSNLILLVCIQRKSYIIFNGLGRLRRNSWFRLLLLFLLKLNSRKMFVFQNYSDFRYFSRYLSREVNWIPGSGGTVRNKGKSSDFLVVTRNSKLPVVLDSIVSAVNCLKLKRLLIVGCSSLESSIQCDVLSPVGYVEQDKIFSFGSGLILPSGYGEGIPHSLVDAIASDMKIFLTQADFIGFGLYRMPFQFQEIASNWGFLTYGPEGRKAVSVNVITAMYMDDILKYYS